MHDQPMNAEQSAHYEYDKAPRTMGRYAREVDIQGKTVLDFGCGWGGETLWLCEHGAHRVIGIDIEVDALEQARSFVGPKAQFTSDISAIEGDSVDFVFSTNVFEHVMDLEAVIEELHRVLKPGGSILSRFGPLFYSPYGCHFYWAKPFPWSHLIMGREWLTRRIDDVRGYDSETSSWEDMGLNKVTYPEFERLIRKHFEINRLEAIPVLGVTPFTKIPGLKRFLTFGCDFNVSKPAAKP